MVKNEEVTVFNKPWYAQGWFLSLFMSLFWFGIALLFMYLGKGSFVWQVLFVFTLLLFIRNLLFDIRKVSITNEDIRFHSLIRIKVVPILNSTITWDFREIYVVKKREFFGGSALKKVYWPGQFNAIKQKLSEVGSYVRNMDSLNSTLGQGGGIFIGSVASGGQGGASPLIIIEMLMAFIVVPLHKVFGKSE